MSKKYCKGPATEINSDLLNLEELQSIATETTENSQIIGAINEVAEGC